MAVALVHHPACIYIIRIRTTATDHMAVPVEHIAEIRGHRTSLRERYWQCRPYIISSDIILACHPACMDATIEASTVVRCDEQCHAHADLLMWRMDCLR